MTKSVCGRADLERETCEGYVDKPTMFKSECKAFFKLKRQRSLRDAA